MILPIENHLKIWTTIIEFKKYINKIAIKFVVGNKWDLEEETIISFQKGIDIAERNDMIFMETFVKKDQLLKRILNYWLMK